MYIQVEKSNRTILGELLSKNNMFFTQLYFQQGSLT